MISTRLLHNDERNLVYDSWLQSYKWSSAARCVASERYYQAQRDLIARLLGVAQCLVAYDVSEPDIALGWACVDAPREVIHYVFVKKDFRRMGIAKTLLGPFADAPMRLSHELRPQIGMRLPERWTYDPFTLMGV